KMDLPSEEVRKNMHIYAENFGLTTWIDHFRLPSNLTQNGMNPDSEFYILDLFRNLGGTSAWSFVDRVANPPNGELDMFRPPSAGAFTRRLASDAIPLRRKRVSRNRLRASAGALALAMVGAGAIGNL